MNSSLFALYSVYNTYISVFNDNTALSKQHQPENQRAVMRLK